MLIDPADASPSIVRQCALLGLSRSSYYYQLASESPENLALMAKLDQEYMDRPFLGSRRLRTWLRRQGQRVNRKRVQRLMGLLGLEAVHPKPRLSKPAPGHRVYPYLLRGVTVDYSAAQFSNGAATDLRDNLRVEVKGVPSADGRGLRATRISFE